MTESEISGVFRELSDNSPNMIFINDFTQVVYVNKKCTEVLGYTREEFLDPSFNFLNIIAPESRHLIDEAFARHNRGEDIEPYEYILLTKDENKIEVVISTKIVQWKGKPAILGTVTDITEYKRLETQLRESEEKYTLFLDSSMDAVFGLKENRFVYANKRAGEMLGYDLDELLKLPVFNIVAPSDRELVRQRTLERLSGGDPPSRYEAKLIRKDGETLMVEFNVSSIEFEGEPMNLTVARDISETVRHRNRLTALLGHAVNLSSATNMDEIISMTLEAMEEALQFQYSSYLEMIDEGLIVRSRFSDSQGLVLPLDGPGLSVKAANTRRSQLVNDTRSDPAYVEGYFYSLSEIDVPIILGNEVVGVLNAEGRAVGTFTDNDLQVLKLLAIHVSSAIERLNRLKEMEDMQADQFQRLIDGYKKTSAAVRHDLRAPLMTIINAIKVLSIQPNNQQMKDILNVKAKFIETVLEDWKHLTYSGEVNRIRVNLLGLITEVVESVSPPSNVEVVIDVDASLVFPLDKNGMVRVVTNIVKNSVEAITGKGRITIKAEAEKGGLVINVTDTGVGIPEDQLPNVFTPFFTTKITGTGIGLSYVKETVEAHGGQVRVSSREGEWTSVNMTFPNPL